MTTTEYLQREIRRTELSIRRAERKPNTPPEELRGLHEKLEHLQEALDAVNEHWQRVHEQMGWTARIDRDAWEPCEICGIRGMAESLILKREKFCAYCGRPLTEEAWAELERRVCGG